MSDLQIELESGERYQLVAHEERKGIYQAQVLGHNFRLFFRKTEKHGWQWCTKLRKQRKNRSKEEWHEAGPVKVKR